jgi:hypothetical protein
MTQLFTQAMPALTGKPDPFSREFIQWLRGLVAEVNAGTADIAALEVALAVLDAAVDALTVAVEVRSVEVDLGSTPVRSGSFNITDAALTAAMQIIITQAPGPYTGKGSTLDESEMDTLDVTARAGSGSAVAYWRSNTLVRGNFKFNYRAG